MESTSRSCGVLAGIEAARAAGLAADQDQRGGAARRERSHAGRSRAAFPRQRPRACASSSTWTSATPTAGGWTRWCRRREIVERIDAELPLEPADASYRGEVAERWRYRDGAGEIGVISSVTQPFCGDCTRARLSPEGKLFTCLFASDGLDLRAPLRAGASDEELAAILRRAWRARDDRYSEAALRRSPQIPRKVEMSHIGG